MCLSRQLTGTDYALHSAIRSAEAQEWTGWVSSHPKGCASQGHLLSGVLGGYDNPFTTNHLQIDAPKSRAVRCIACERGKLICSVVEKKRWGGIEPSSSDTLEIAAVSGVRGTHSPYQSILTLC